MKFFAGVSVVYLVSSVVLFSDFDTSKTITFFTLPPVTFALIAIACAIKEHGERIQRGANPPQVKSDTRG
ncbi:MAG: hypothetical protein WAP55_03725 [Minisyncoccia bacterium]